MRKGEKRPDLYKARIAVCPVCGKEFRAVKECRGRVSKYCSKECWSIRARVINHCLYCGKEIITTKSVNKKYCGNDCRNLDYRNRQKGEASHFWRGGKTQQRKILRTSAEYKVWRNAVFLRDGYKCQECGKSGRDLEPHHLKEICNYPELIFDIDNGITLCHECHKETDNYGYKARWENFTGQKAELVGG